MAVTKDEVYKKVQTALVDALGVDEDEVTPEATMVGDLGAESIDFLDIVFKLEKAFSIEIPRKELSPEDILTNFSFTVPPVNFTHDHNDTYPRRSTTRLALLARVARITHF